MKAIRIHEPGGLQGLVYEDVPRPKLGLGEVLVQVYATGVTPMEPTWETSTGEYRPLPVIPGYELSGIVTEVADDVTEVKIGDEVYARISAIRDGAEAEYAIVPVGELAPKPRSLTHVQAAAIPQSALTAWQAMFDHAHLALGQTILIHGAAGGVGVLAVQLAHWAGAKIIATSSKNNLDFIRKLGADEVIDYTATRFEEVVHDVDVVFDMIGGDTLERSWQTLKQDGFLVTIAAIPDLDALQTKARTHNVHADWFIVVPNKVQLTKIGALIDEGILHPILDSVFPLSQARQAYEHGLAGHTRGKIVLQVVDD